MVKAETYGEMRGLRVIDTVECSSGRGMESGTGEWK